MIELKPNIYEARQRKLFIDSSKRSLKSVLLHKRNQFACILVAHSTVFKEYINMETLKKRSIIRYISRNLKIFSMILGQQFPCFVCHWDSREREREN